tara:strand:+ start:443 stop:1018 length:576 start_codon:yes stop_codon:yes gene_type:complete
MKNLIIISAPSGAGKTTLCRSLQEVMSDIDWSISYTTREKREMEKDGIDYHFINKNVFHDLIKNNSFAEWEKVHGHYYGTNRTTLEIAISENKFILLEMDVKGAISIKRLYPKNTFSIFISPPSIDHLRKRLLKRGSESLEKIETRLKRYKKEMDYINKFDHIMINDDFSLARQELINIINKLKKGVYNGT